MPDMSPSSCVLTEHISEDLGTEHPCKTILRVRPLSTGEQTCPSRPAVPPQNATTHATVPIGGRSFQLDLSLDRKIRTELLPQELGQPLPLLLERTFCFFARESGGWGGPPKSTSRRMRLPIWPDLAEVRQRSAGLQDRHHHTRQATYSNGESSCSQAST